MTPFLFAGILLAAAAAGQESATEFTKAAESNIIALENAWNQAQLNHDTRALDGLITPGFVYTDYDGTVMDKAKFLADAKDPGYVPSLMVNDGVKVRLYQTVAIVTGTYHAKGTYNRKPFDHWGRFTDTWVKENAIWRCVASHTNLIKK